MQILVLALLALCFLLWAPTGAADPARFEAGRVEDTRQGGARVTLTLSHGVPWRLFTLDAPRRLVLDFGEVTWQGAEAARIDAAEAVTGLRMGAFRPGWSRMVLDLAEPLEVSRAGLSIAPETGRATLRLRLVPVQAERFAAAAGTPPAAVWMPASLPTAPRQPSRPEAANADPPLVVMLDPGHGGIDPGARRGGINEADLVLQFARELRAALTRSGGFDVRLTRDSDHFVSLEARVAMAQSARADLFISLHADAIEAGMAEGASVYVLSRTASDAASAALAERHNRGDLLAGIDLSGSDDRVAQVLMDLARLDNAPRSAALAGHLVDGMRDRLGQVNSRPLRQAGFAVLKAADIPSVLVELGFLSTKTDLNRLQDPAWRARLAAGIRDGILAWHREDTRLAPLRRR